MSRKKVKMSKTRHRLGCDICKKDEPTEYFEGMVGGELWVCDKCYHKITKWTKSKE